MSVNQIGLILLVACLVAMLSRRLRLPYSVGLVAAGISLSHLGSQIKLTLTPDLVYTVLLPPLIFEAALQLNWRPFRDNLLVSSNARLPRRIVGGGDRRRRDAPDRRLGLAWFGLVRRFDRSHRPRVGDRCA